MVGVAIAPHTPATVLAGEIFDCSAETARWAVGGSFRVNIDARTSRPSHAHHRRTGTEWARRKTGRKGSATDAKRAGRQLDVAASPARSLAADARRLTQVEGVLVTGLGQRILVSGSWSADPGHWAAWVTRSPSGPAGP